MTPLDDPLDFAVQCAALLNQAPDQTYGWVRRLPHDASLRPGGVWLRGIWMGRRDDGWELRPHGGGITVIVRRAASVADRSTGEKAAA